MKYALITGASSGIGKAITEHFLSRQITVFGVCRNPEKEMVSSPLYFPIACNLESFQEISHLKEKLLKNVSLNYLILNAGIGYFGPHEEISLKNLHKMVTLNLEAPLLLTQLFLRDLKKTHGTIILLSSVTAKKTNTHGCAYGATKAGLSSFGQSLFEEVRKYGVKVITLHPDMTQSHFYDEANFKEGEEPESYLLPEEIADTIDFIIDTREGCVINDITIRPQIHRIKRKESKL